jgi:hypothetical protein
MVDNQKKTGGEGVPFADKSNICVGREKTFLSLVVFSVPVCVEAGGDHRER